MAWIESHQTLARHPKVIRLANLLRIHRAQAIGHLHYLWWWTLDYAPTGRLSAFTSDEIAAAAEWTGKGGSEAFVGALVEARWLDQKGSETVCHDWMEYAGKLISDRERDKERKQLERERAKKDREQRLKPDSSGGCPADVQRTADGVTPYPTQPNPTQPNLNTAGDVAREGDCVTRAVVPGWSDVWNYSQTIGLAEWKAKDWWEEMESIGWIDYQSRPVQKWQPMLTRVCRKWEADGRPKTPPVSQKINGSGRPASVMDIKTAIQIKEERAATMKEKYCPGDTLGSAWNDLKQFEEWKALRREIRGLKQRIETMV